MITRERLVESVVGSQVLDVRVVAVTSVEVEVLSVRLLLDNEISRFRVHLHLLVSNVRHCSIAFSDLFNHSDVEASSVLIVGHKSQTFG